MTKRPLTEDEIKMNTLSITRISAERDILEFKREYHDLMIKKGLKSNFDEKMMEYKAKYKQILEELETSEKIINALKDQITNGVDLKEEEENGG